MTEEVLNRIALIGARKTGMRQLRALLNRYQSATELIKRHPELVDAQAMEYAQKELLFIEKHQIQTYFYQDDNYPDRLAQCADAPLLLYAKGEVNVNPKHAVSIVGTRTPSERGKDWCRRLVLELAEQVPELTIISGLAYGIDVVAHKAAIEAGIPTLIIPAHGLDRIYPAAHRHVAVKALNNGGILTEYTSGTEPERYNFVARNRIVAGMADAVVVVESKEKGGSLITASMAVDYGRDVFALPGRADDVFSAGCNALIKHHKAQLIENAKDLIEAMQWQSTTQPHHPIQTSLMWQMSDLTEQQQRLLDLLRESEDGLHINQLVLETQLPYHVVSSELIMMELQDVIKSMPGGMWRVKK